MWGEPNACHKTPLSSMAYAAIVERVHRMERNREALRARMQAQTRESAEMFACVEALLALGGDVPITVEELFADAIPPAELFRTVAESHGLPLAPVEDEGFFIASHRIDTIARTDPPHIVVSVIMYVLWRITAVRTVKAVQGVSCPTPPKSGGAALYAGALVSSTGERARGAAGRFMATLGRDDDSDDAPAMVSGDATVFINQFLRRFPSHEADPDSAGATGTLYVPVHDAATSALVAKWPEGDSMHPLSPPTADECEAAPRTVMRSPAFVRGAAAPTPSISVGRRIVRRWLVEDTNWHHARFARTTREAYLRFGMTAQMTERMLLIAACKYGVNAREAAAMRQGGAPAKVTVTKSAIAASFRVQAAAASKGPAKMTVVRSSDFGALPNVSETLVEYAIALGADALLEAINADGKFVPITGPGAAKVFTVARRRHRRRQEDTGRGLGEMARRLLAGGVPRHAKDELEKIARVFPLEPYSVLELEDHAERAAAALVASE